MSSSERDVYRTARSSVIVRPGAWSRRAFPPVVADRDDGRRGERTIDGHLDIGGRGAAGMRCGDRLGEVEPGEGARLLRDVLDQQPVEPLVERHRSRLRRSADRLATPSRG